ncbi:MAG: CotH kinase family protein [Bacteroidia bacterium]
MKNKFRFQFTKYSLIASLIFISLFQSAQCLSQCCTYHLHMHDSYGDGWNGGFLEIYINNALVGNYSGSNFGSTDTFTICNGDSLQLLYTAGMYENENTYQLYDAAYNLVFADGPTPQTGNVFSTTGNCFSITVPGNNPCTAIPIDTGQCLMSDNTGFIGSGLNPKCASYVGGDVWFTMQVPPSGNLSFETDSGTLTDTGIAVWTDSTCTNLKLLGCDDDAGNGYYSLLFLNDLTPGQALYIQVWGYGGATGSFQLCANDLGIVSLDSSELPIVMINTLGQTIVPDTKINALMEIKYNGPNSITYITDSANEYNGNIGIAIRGAFSSGFPQHPYGFETRTAAGANNNVSILGMPAENDWVLIPNFNDRSLIRNTLACRLFADMGNYSPRTSLCEVLVDSSYKGIYVLSEKIKRDKGRVDIAKLTTSDNTGDSVTGGYILQQNYWDGSNSFQSNYSPIDHPGFDVHFVYEYPKADSITIPQKNYIASYIDSLEDALYSINFTDTVSGYRKYLDVKSFIDYFLVNELSRNNDGFKKSVFFNKDKFSKGGKLKAGPVWDFDWAWKNLYGCSIFEAIDGSGWAHHINDCFTDNYSCGWYIRLLQDSIFNNELRCTYENYRQTILDTAYIFSYMDSVRNLVQNAQARHFKKWPILGVSGPAPEVGAIATTYNAEIDTLKAWINLRLQWLDANIPGLCSYVGMEQLNSIQTLKCFPNPSTGNFHFEGLINESSTLSIYDAAGKMIDHFEINKGNVQLNYQLNRKGVFYFRITNRTGLLQYGKLVVI